MTDSEMVDAMVSNVCQHGQLKRQCPLCEKDAEIAALEQRFDALSSKFAALVEENAALRKRREEAERERDELKEENETLRCHAYDTETH